jgi:hypothetical protein
MSDLGSAVCESCGSTNTQQTGTEARPFPGDGIPTIVTDHECLDCGDRWNVWH